MTRNNRYIYLLCGLLLFLLASPLARQYLPIQALFVGDLALSLALVIGIWSLMGSRRSFIWGGLVVAIACVLLLSGRIMGVQTFEYVGRTVTVVFCVLTASIALRDVLFGGVLDLNRLTGAICVYLLIGIAWAIMYALVDELTVLPAFTNLEAADIDRTLNGFLYYSFVTLTTLGYGDIYPISPVARTLAYMEATIGQLYLTILVAALVGLIAPTIRQQVERTQGSTETEA